MSLYVQGRSHWGGRRGTCPPNIFGNCYKKVPAQNDVALAQSLIDGINPLDKTTMSVEKGVYLNENVIYGETKWQTFKNAMDPLSKITTNHAMRQFRKDFYPEKGICMKIEKGCK